VAVNVTYHPSAPGSEPLGCLVLFLTQDDPAPPSDLPEPWRGPVVRALGLKEFTGKSGQSCVLLPAEGNAERLLLIGLGKTGKLDRETLRRAAGGAGKALVGMKIPQAGAWLPEQAPEPLKAGLAEVLAEGLLLGAYTFKPYKAAPEEERDRTELEQVHLYDPLGLSSADAAGRGIARGEAVCFARTLGNHPGNVMTPSRLAQEARELASRRGLKVTVLEQSDMESLRMGLLLGVARGSRQPPKLIVLEYRPAGAKDTLAFVGKGITFDSGGISLKPGQAMDEMKFDMCGAAAVLGALDAIARIGAPVNVVGIVPTCENLPGGQATKPGDIHRSFSGKFVEILNTDAEGRLILADALAYGIQTYKPVAVVDLATLTGACVVALGHYATGAVSNRDPFQHQVVAAGRAAGDVIWPLPGLPEYEEGLKGKYADLQNIAGREGGAITGGLFLKNFVGEVPWVHLDIAGTAWGVKNIGHVPDEGATGVGVCLLLELARSWNGADV
jgi:leucyl aminopeptidase